MSSRAYFNLDYTKWLTDPCLSMCSPATRGIWFDLICAMYQDRKATLTGTHEQLARLARCSPSLITDAITELQITRTAIVHIDAQNSTVSVTCRYIHKLMNRQGLGRDRVKRFREKPASETPVKRGCNAGVTRPPSSIKGISKADKPVKIDWSAPLGFTGISDAHTRAWTAANPACNIDRQIASMHSWLMANPKKAHKSNWERFITNWLARAQDRGGDATATPQSNGFEGLMYPRRTKEERAALMEQAFKDDP